MNTLINETLQDSTMYKDLSHYLFNNLLLSHSNDKSFDVFNVFHWVYLLATICGVLGLILAVLVQCRIRTLFVLLAKTGHSHALGQNGDESKLPTLIYPKTSMSTPTTTLDRLRFHRMIQTLLPWPYCSVWSCSSLCHLAICSTDTDVRKKPVLLSWSRSPAINSS